MSETPRFRVGQRVRIKDESFIPYTGEYGTVVFIDEAGPKDCFPYEVRIEDSRCEQMFNESELESEDAHAAPAEAEE